MPLIINNHNGLFQKEINIGVHNAIRNLNQILKMINPYFRIFLVLILSLSFLLATQNAFAISEEEIDKLIFGLGKAKQIFKI